VIKTYSCGTNSYIDGFGTLDVSAECARTCGSCPSERAPLLFASSCSMHHGMHHGGSGMHHGGSGMHNGGAQKSLQDPTSGCYTHPGPGQVFKMLIAISASVMSKGW